MTRSLGSPLCVRHAVRKQQEQDAVVVDAADVSVRQDAVVVQTATVFLRHFLRFSVVSNKTLKLPLVIPTSHTGRW